MSWPEWTQRTFIFHSHFTRIYTYLIGQTNARPEDAPEADLMTEEDVTRKYFHLTSLTHLLNLFLFYRRSPSYRKNRYSRRSRSRSGGRGDSRSREYLKEGRCFLCGERGHIKANCPESRGGRRSPPRRDNRRDRSGSRHNKRSRSSSSVSRGNRGDKRRGGSSRSSSRGEADYKRWCRSDLKLKDKKELKFKLIF